LQLGSEVTHCQFIQGVQSCCFCSCVALQLQLCLVSPSPSKMGQFSFEYCLQSHETSSRIHSLLWEVHLSSHPPLSLCCFSHLCSLRVQFLDPTLFSGTGSVFHPNPAVGVRLQFAVYAFQFCWWGVSVCPWAVLDYVSGWWVGEFHVVCVVPLQIHATSFGTGWQGEMAQHREASLG
jgi:hypothetical protein